MGVSSGKEGGSSAVRKLSPKRGSHGRDGHDKRDEDDGLADVETGQKD